jgi:hypothetical protein
MNAEFFSLGALQHRLRHSVAPNRSSTVDENCARQLLNIIVPTARAALEVLL